jgi:hypothetical protein
MILCLARLKLITSAFIRDVFAHEIGPFLLGQIARDSFADRIG